MVNRSINIDQYSTRAAWDEKYRSGPTPWDTRISPPEVQAFWRTQRLDPADNLLALDFGCGTGTNAAYLAGLGIHTIGIEVSSIALQSARHRHLNLIRKDILHFVQADVTRVPFAHAQANYALDIGCMHGLPLDLRADYARGVIANLAPGGYYQLYAFDRVPAATTDAKSDATSDALDMRGLAPGELESLFTPWLTIVEAIAARPDRRPCHWYLLHKPR
ncbi:MAG: class I SAM-dependent methyltransferase [Litorilinea sp.]